jgi:hypothetical protein
MIFRRTVTKKEKRKAYKKRLGILLIFVGLLLVNFIFIYFAFLEKPKPIISPLSKNQTTSLKQIEIMLQKYKIEYISISTQKDLNYLVKLKNGAQIVLDPSKNIDQELSSLQLILSQLKIEGKTLKRLDFRYKKPIIVF